MTDNPRLLIRRWAQLACGATLILYGIVGFPTPDNLQPRQAAAQSTCFIFCSDFTVTIGHEDGSTSTLVYDYDSKTFTNNGEDFTPDNPIHDSPPTNTETVFEDTTVTTTYNDNGGTSTTVNEYDSETDTTTTTTNTYGGGEDRTTTTTTNTGDYRDTPTTEETEWSPDPVSISDIDQEFDDHDGTFNRDGDAGKDAVRDWMDAQDPPLDYNDPRVPIPRDAVNYGHCVSFGLSGCDIHNARDTYHVMDEEGVSEGYTDDPDYADFRGDDPTTNANIGGSDWFGRCPKSVCGGGWHSPVVNDEGSNPNNNFGGNTPVCSLGYVVMAAHVDSSTNDNGCRPPQCDFGRDTDGWCLPPANSDPPTIYLLGPNQHVTEADGTVGFSVVLSHAVNYSVSVTANTVDDTATAGDDYRAVSGTVTVPRGRTSLSVMVGIIDDTAYEPTESFMMQLSSPSNGNLNTDPQTQATIQDDDIPPVVVSISGSPTTEEGGYLDFTVSLDTTPTTDVSVSFRGSSPYYENHPQWVHEGLACGGVTDYIAADSLYQTQGYEVLEWAAGDSSSKTASIITCDDNLDEADTKTLDVELYSPRGAQIGTGKATGTITDNDAPSPHPTVTNPTWFIDSPTVTEGDDLEFTAVFMPIGDSWKGTVTITLSGTATLGPAGGGCGAGVDAYIDRNQPSNNTYAKVKFSQGGWQGGATVPLKVKTCDDATPEALETLTATLSTTPVSGGTAADVGPAGTGTIIDNDFPEVYLDGDVAAAEGDSLDFTLSLRSVLPEDVTVTLSTATDNSPTTTPATASGTLSDYLPLTNYQVTIPAGDLSAPVRVFTVDDTADEQDNETFLLRIEAADSPIGANVGSPSEAVGTIRDNDDLPTVSLSDVSADEGLGVIAFAPTLSAASHKTVTVTVSTGSSTPMSAVGVTTCSADDGTEDYQITTSTVTIHPGSTIPASILDYFLVAVCDDTALEADESFTVTLTNPINATLGTATATGTIRDNDDPVNPCPAGWIHEPTHVEADHRGCRPGFLS